MSRKVAVDTDRKRGTLFKVSETGGRLIVYGMKVGLISDTQTKIGEARSLHDAIEIIKASVSGTVRNIKVSNW